jgi:molecular chaperone DnaK
LAEKINFADNIIYQIEKMLRENADKINEEDKNRINDAVQALRRAVESKDLNQINEKANDLQKLLLELGTKMYSTANSPESEVASA